MDPVTIAALIGGASQVLSASMSAAPAAPSAAYSGGGFTNASYDNSGWNVQTGGGLKLGGATGGSSSNILMYGLLALGALWILGK